MRPARNVLLRGCTLLALGATACAGGPPRPASASVQEPARARGGEATYRYQPPPQLADGWQISDAREAGFEIDGLEGMTEAIRRGEEYRNIHAVLVVKDGRLVYEEYFAGEDTRRGARVHVDFGPDTLHSLRSITKSAVSALVGIAIAEGAIRSMDQPLFDFFPEHADLATPEKHAITLRHALDMTAGLAWNERIPYTDSLNSEIRMNGSDDPVRFVLQQPLVDPPGTRWNYSGGMTQLLAAVVERATGRTVLEYAEQALFEPLGIRRSMWWQNDNGTYRAASGLGLTARDLAKFGLLYQQQGRWNGRQVLPAAYVDASLARAVAVADSLVELSQDAFAEHGYAHQWWHSHYTLPYGEVVAHRALGNGGQRIWIVPEHQLVVVVNSGRYDQFQDSDRLVLERVLPAALGFAGSDYRFWQERAVRQVSPGEWPEVALTVQQRAGYAGVYLYEGEQIEVRDEAGVLLMTGFGGADGGPIHLVPMGDHVFAHGRYEDGRLTGIYWPTDRIEFVMDGDRATGFLDRTAEGSVYARAERIR
ncbi:hypothetical protein BH23GEM9_BH23GEM9_15630 [soil metagenome]